ncbi:unnamed protein product [Lathyrus oleraceus]
MFIPIFDVALASASVQHRIFNLNRIHDNRISKVLNFENSSSNRSFVRSTSNKEFATLTTRNRNKNADLKKSKTHRFRDCKLDSQSDESAD